MAFNIQDADGTIDGANAYASAAAVKSYWLDRGVDLTTKPDSEIEVAIIKATDFLDARFMWAGAQRRVAQGTQWPRVGVPAHLRGLPQALVNATCMLASRALVKPLMPDPKYDPSGQVVQESTKKVGPIEVSLKFAATTGGTPESAVPQYPDVVLMLRGAGMLSVGRNTGSVVRA